ncbi:MAG: LemA family protein [Clostridia bacterium]
MKKTWLIVIGVIAAIILIAGIWLVSVNNSLIVATESISQNQAEIENQLKRRADLIPNLVNTVKGITKQELDVVNSITSSREKMLTGSTQDKLNANSQVTRGISLLVENYPEIKSNTNFTSLQDELAGTENRIAVARKKYNDEVASFNKKRKVFPTSVVASMFGHEEVKYLEVSETDKQNPKVEF